MNHFAVADIDADVPDVALIFRVVPEEQQIALLKIIPRNELPDMALIIVVAVN
ncbi:hypothetical protein D3C84_1209730 [compost metagenome]